MRAPLQRSYAAGRLVLARSLLSSSRAALRTLSCVMKPVDVTTLIDIARPREVVAAYVADPDHTPDWYANIERVNWQTEKPLTTGPCLCGSFPRTNPLLHIRSDRLRAGRAACHGYGRGSLPNGDDLYLDRPSGRSYADDPTEPRSAIGLCRAYRTSHGGGHETSQSKGFGRAQGTARTPIMLLITVGQFSVPHQ